MIASDKAHNALANRRFYFVMTFLVTSFSVFGPKVFGVLDTAVLVPLLLVSAFVLLNRRFVIDRSFQFALGILSLVAVWTGIAWLIGAPDTVYILLRTARAFLSTALLYSFFYYIGSRGLMSARESLLMVLTALAVQVPVIYMQIIFPSVQVAIGDLYGFTKTVRTLRAFGLTAGYDSAGYLTAFLCAAVLAYALVTRSRLAFLASLVSGGAVLFTSRTSMLMLLGLISIVLYVCRHEIRKNLGKMIVLTAAGSVAAIAYVVQIFMASLFGEDESRRALLGTSVEAQFATTATSEVISRMLLLPQTTHTTFFGIGRDVIWSDIGYVNAIYMGGWILLVGFLLFYLALYSLSVTAWRLAGSGVATPRQEGISLIWRCALLLLLIVMLLGNLKNLYFLTRGYHELYIVLTGLAVGCASWLQKTRRLDSSGGADGGQKVLNESL